MARLKSFFLFAIFLAGCQPCSGSHNSTGPETAKVSIGEKTFQVEIADTAERIEKGLMFRERLTVRQGMLFVYPQAGIYPFWMKNTLIPLDVVWIDEKLQVIDVQTMVPCTEEQAETSSCPLYSPPAPFLYALEVNAGECQDCRGAVAIIK